MNATITQAPPAVHELLEEIRATAQLNQAQRNELFALLWQGKLDTARDLLNAWK